MLDLSEQIVLSTSLYIRNAFSIFQYCNDIENIYCMKTILEKVVGKKNYHRKRLWKKSYKVYFDYVVGENLFNIS